MLTKVKLRSFARDDELALLAVRITKAFEVAMGGPQLIGNDGKFQVMSDSGMCAPESVFRYLF
ncbi:hypothetical protein PRUB_b1163 [Pseudoalteromonas rubra]|uniref:Uncharacterized protein n=1 Tax=Pseudoalteromonas rubra TaxID=43658 RepID=A0A8T0C2C6_9GAMM|nr:hypothetical protein [Pseudoalteromonas rubra]KAF7781824.1 hypothetical protein PRUB_b1163 [Pseudoalteromonas rubra]